MVDQKNCFNAAWAVAEGFDVKLVAASQNTALHHAVKHGAHLKLVDQ